MGELNLTCQFGRSHLLRVAFIRKDQVVTTITSAAARRAPTLLYPCGTADSK